MAKKTNLEDVMKVIHKWQEDNDVIFHGGFASFDKEGEVIEDRLICFGDRGALQISLEDFNKEFKKDKSRFVNW